MRRLAAMSLLALAASGVAHGAWSADAAGSGATSAKTMPGGNVPSGTVSGSNVTLTWTGSSFPEGGAVPGYVIRRFNNITQAEETVLSACAGIVAATSCTENGVPIGTWRYTVTPAAGGWRGGQSAQSDVITVLV